MRKLLIASVLTLGMCGAPMLMAQSSHTVREVQRALKDNGCNPGPIDGIDGPRTHAAIREYQKKENLNENGRLGPETLAALGVKSEGAGTEMQVAGTQVRNSYDKGAKDVAHGSEKMASQYSHGNVVKGTADFGKGVGHGAEKIGVGTYDAAKDVGKGVKDAVTGH